MGISSTKEKPEKLNTLSPSTPSDSVQPRVSSLSVPTKTTSPKIERTINEENKQVNLRKDYDELETSLDKLKLDFTLNEIVAPEGIDTSKYIAELDLEALTEDSNPNIQAHTQEQEQTVDNQSLQLEATEVEKDNDTDELKLFFAKFRALQSQVSSIQSDTAAKSRPETLVILSPNSYKHVFSRNWYSKSYKASVVERPERLLATSIGIGSAMAEYPTRFALRQSSKRVDLRTAASVTKVHGPDWANRLYDLCKVSGDKLAKNEVEVPNDWHSGDIYLAPGTIDAVEGVVGAIEYAVNALYGETEQGSDGFENVFVTVRPPGHHSHTCEPSGFCLINNVHIAIQYAAEKHGITHAIVLDFDLHHGDGTQDICWKLSGIEDDDNNKETNNESATDISEKNALSKIGYFSLHDINSFPTETGYATASNIKNASVCVMAHDICIWNVHLEKFTSEEEFMELYDKKYSVLFVKAHEYLQQCQTTHTAQLKAAVATAKHNSNGRHKKHKSKSCASRASNSSDSNEKIEGAFTAVPFKPLIVLSAGFDASEYENVNMRRHGVNVPNSFYHRFTQDAKALARAHSREAKVLSLLEGGYSDGALSAGVYSHLTGFATTSESVNSSDKNGSSGYKDNSLSPAHNNAMVTKLMEQGCKPQWDAAKMASAHTRRSTSLGMRLKEADYRWLAQGIELGRLLWPREFFPLDVTRASNSPRTKDLAKELVDLTSSFRKLDVEDEESLLASNSSDPDLRTSGKRILRNRSQLQRIKDS
jgi:histone deacetylase HOS3